MREDPLEYDDIWSVPLHRLESYLHAEISISLHTFYTSRQLEKLHRQLAHTSAMKLYQLLKTPGKEDVTPKTLEKLEATAARCELCRKISNAPTRFRVTIGSENVTFNSTVFIVTMYRDRELVPHLVDDGTCVSAALIFRNIFVSLDLSIIGFSTSFVTKFAWFAQICIFLSVHACSKFLLTFL